MHVDESDDDNDDDADTDAYADADADGDHFNDRLRIEEVQLTASPMYGCVPYFGVVYRGLDWPHGGWISSTLFTHIIN